MTDTKDGSFPTATALLDRVCNGLEDVERLMKLGGWITSPDRELETISLPDPDTEYSAQWPDSLLIKSKWGDGPWLREPDMVIFRAKAAPRLRCAAWRQPMFGQLNGYVLVPAGTKLHGAGYADACRFETTGAHRGLTYAAPTEGGNTVLGFHCGNAFDYQPALEARTPRWLAGDGPDVPAYLRRAYRDLPYVRAELEALAHDIRTAMGAS